MSSSKDIHRSFKRQLPDSCLQSQPSSKRKKTNDIETFSQNCQAESMEETFQDQYRNKKARKKYPVTPMGKKKKNHINISSIETYNEDSTSESDEPFNIDSYKLYNIKNLIDKYLALKKFDKHLNHKIVCHNDDRINTIAQLLQCHDLFIVMCEYLTIDEFLPISIYLNKEKSLNESPIIKAMMLQRISESITKSLNEPRLSVKELIHVYSDQCIKNSTSPFLFYSKFDHEVTTLTPRLECIKHKNFFKHKSIIDIGNYGLKNNYGCDYIFFGTMTHYLFCILFKNTSLLHFINIFCSFAPVPLENIVACEYSIGKDDTDFRNNIKGQMNIYESEMNHICMNLWSDFPKIIKHKPVIISSISDFYSNLKLTNVYNEWHKLIDWRYFFIGDSTVLFALIGSIYNHSVVELFSYDQTNQQFQSSILLFANKLRQNGINFSICNSDRTKFTFSLSNIHRDRSYNITLQFQWICKYVSIADILTSFNLAASQIAFIPNINCMEKSRLVFSHAFRYYVNTGKCFVFNFQIPKIRIYEKSGVNHFLIPSNKYLNYLQEYNQKQINKESDHNQNKISFIGDHSSLKKKAHLNNNIRWHHDHSNVDENRIFFKFIHSLTNCQ